MEEVLWVRESIVLLKVDSFGSIFKPAPAAVESHVEERQKAVDDKLGDKQYVGEWFHKKQCTKKLENKLHTTPDTGSGAFRNANLQNIAQITATRHKFLANFYKSANFCKIPPLLSPLSCSLCGSHPSWGATVISDKTVAPSSFQSTHPRGATHKVMSSERTPKVSIHAPA